MASVLDNFELGLAGSVDAASRADDYVADLLGLSASNPLRILAKANNTYLAPAVYGRQEGTTPAQRAQLEHAGEVAEDHGALSKAAGKTLADLDPRGALNSLKWWLIGAGVVVAVVAGAVIVVKVAK